MAFYALLASINRYGNEHMPPLQFAERDGEVLQLLLTERGYKAVHLAGEKATRENILNILSGNVTSLGWPAFKPEDTFLFFFAGHGELVGGSYVLHAHGARPGNAIHSVPVRDIAHSLKEMLPCNQAACIIDACRNLARPGARGVAGLDAQSTRDIKAVASSTTEQKLVAMLYGCDEGQISLEHESLGHGVLTYHLAEVLRENTHWTLEDTFDEAADRIRDWCRRAKSGHLQEPQLYRPGGKRKVTLFCEANVQHESKSIHGYNVENGRRWDPVLNLQNGESSPRIEDHDVTPHESVQFISTPTPTTRNLSAPQMEKTDFPDATIGVELKMLAIALSRGPKVALLDRVHTLLNRLPRGFLAPKQIDDAKALARQANELWNASPRSFQNRTAHWSRVLTEYGNHLSERPDGAFGNKARAPRWFFVLLCIAPATPIVLTSGASVALQSVIISIFGLAPAYKMVKWFFVATEWERDKFAKQKTQYKKDVAKFAYQLQDFADGLETYQ